MQQQITGKTGMMCLIGSPVGHSGSPAMHNYGFQKLGLDYVYLAFDVTEERVGEAIAAMRILGIRGANATMPCKTQALRHMDKLSPAAALIGAVNTIVNDDGVLTGHNTDGVGFVRSLAEEGISVKGKRITLLGGGGAATAIYVQCALEGAAQISVFTRREKDLSMLRQKVPGCDIAVHSAADGAALRQCVADSHILINATLVGMAPNAGEAPIEAELLHGGLAVADVVYNPRETRLLREAAAVGCKTVGGIGMLLWQGAEAFRLFTGHELPVDEVRQQFFQ